MFVAGLTEGVPSASPASPSITPSASLALSTSPPTTTPVGSPPTETPELSGDASTQDPFAALIARLRNVLTYRKKGTVWDPNRAKAFQIILVDKAVRFPPRKVYPPAAGGTSQSGTPRSPLSPMTPSSPVYPDGLIAPIWVRKHVELVPSVFVLFLRLAEFPAPASPLDGKDDSTKEEERRRDAELATEIAARKKITSDRGMKLTVVLLASRKMLDDPTLDSRLSFIRRQSGLDSRAALFVLSPVSHSELNDFVKSLQTALYDAAMEYYAAHSKRVRRKRNRHSHANHASITSIPTAPGTSPGSTGMVGPRPLRSIGWQVRYDYKLALFAEFRMEEEVARKHYEDCWTSLTEMFSSTAVLPPRTKRWAEAKVLADCIAVKLFKLYLYHNEPHIALATFNRHLQKFSDLSRGWGIGDETFEFWSWMARMYRILAELLEMALRAGYKLPIVSAPALPSRAPSTGTTPPNDKASGLNPSNVLQHPGYYYYTAANCTLQRYERFLAILEQEETQPGSASQSPGFANEKKVEHHVIIIELFTKAYELFKRFRTGQSRQTFYIAYRIAETYHAAGNYEAAIRFFERIAKTYRREQWGSMLRSILLMWYDCARHLGDVELTIKLLFELLAPGVTKDLEERATFQGDLESILKNSSPTTPDQPLVVSLAEGESIFDVSVVFWRSEVSVGEAATFQVTLAAPKDISLAAFTFSSLRIQLGDQNLPPVVVHHAESAETAPVERVDFGHLTAQGLSPPDGLSAHLCWPIGATKVFSGSLMSKVPMELKVTGITLVLAQGEWNVELPLALSSEAPFSEATIRPKQWLVSTHPPVFTPVYRPNCSTSFARAKPHRLDVQVKHPSPSYLDEKYGVTVRISNEDERELDVKVDVLLQPTEDESVNRIIVDEEDSTALIKGIPFGVVPAGANASKTLYLISTGSAGSRILDISIRSHTTTSSGPRASGEHDAAALGESSEILKTLSIPVVQPFSCTSTVAYHRSSGSLRPLLDLALYDRGEFDARVFASVETEVANAGKWELELGAVTWNAKTSGKARMVSSSVDAGGDRDDEEFPIVLSSGDQYAIMHKFEIDGEEELGEEAGVSIPCPGELVVKWRRLGAESWTTSALTLPAFRPPEDGVVGLLSVPPSAVLHQPFVATLTIQNRHPSRTSDLVLQTESSEAFVVAGPRTARLPTLLPSTSVDIRFNVVPLLCGTCRLPTFKVYDRRRQGMPASTGGETGEETITLQAVQIVDGPSDARDESGNDLLLYVPSAEDTSKLEARKDGITMLVLPSM